MVDLFIPMRQIFLTLIKRSSFLGLRNVVSNSVQNFDACRIIRLIYTCDLDLAISLSNAISIEILPSFQIATAGDSDNV
jgi:hypothetical protein